MCGSRVLLSAVSGSNIIIEEDITVDRNIDNIMVLHQNTRCVFWVNIIKEEETFYKHIYSIIPTYYNIRVLCLCLSSRKNMAR